MRWMASFAPPVLAEDHQRLLRCETEVRHKIVFSPFAVDLADHRHCQHIAQEHSGSCYAECKDTDNDSATHRNAPVQRMPRRTTSQANPTASTATMETNSRRQRLYS